jgi:hypothetical protein
MGNVVAETVGVIRAYREACEQEIMSNPAMSADFAKFLRAPHGPEKAALGVSLWIACGTFRRWYWSGQSIPTHERQMQPSRAAPAR